MITKEQYQSAIKAEKEARETINAYHVQKTEEADARRASGKPFTDEELIYSAFTLCPCGHGYAYPRECGSTRQWDCSAILKGIATEGVKHGDVLPFAFYEVKSEEQPSANGHTTRGVFRPKPN